MKKFILIILFMILMYSVGGIYYIEYAKALEENIECLIKVKKRFNYLRYFEDERAIWTKIKFLKIQDRTLKNIYLLKTLKTMPTSIVFIRSQLIKIFLTIFIIY